MPVPAGVAAAIQGCASNRLCTAAVQIGVTYAASKALEFAEKQNYGPAEVTAIRSIGDAAKNTARDWAATEVK